MCNHHPCVPFVIPNKHLIHLLCTRLAAIEAEKEKLNFINGIEHFDTKKLKPTETVEKNPLPTKEIIAEEKKA